MKKTRKQKATTGTRKKAVQNPHVDYAYIDNPKQADLKSRLIALFVLKIESAWSSLDISNGFQDLINSTVRWQHDKLNSIEVTVFTEGVFHKYGISVNGIETVGISRSEYFDLTERFNLTKTHREIAASKWKEENNAKMLNEEFDIAGI